MPKTFLKKKMNRKENRGFTFIELLLALAIFSIMAVTIYLTLNTGIRVWSRGNSVIAFNQKIRVFFDILSQDLKNLSNITIYSGADEKIEPEWKADNISFLTSRNIFHKDKMYREIVKVMYYMGKGGSSSFVRGGEETFTTLSRREGFTDKNSREDVLLEGVKSVSFAYCYKISEEEYEWKDEWDIEEKIPRGLKIKIAVINETRDITEEFEKNILIPIGELGKEE